MNEVLKRFGDRFKAAIKEGYNKEGVRASGKSIDTLREEIDNNRYVLYGVGYWRSIDKGRGKTVKKTGGLFTGLYKWLAFKKYGIVYKNDKERKSIAFALMKKISKEGSAKFRGKVDKTFIIEDAIKKTLPGLRSDIKNAIRQSQITKIKSMYNDGN